ncbi:MULTISPECIES: DUF6414 family protein [Enterococcus]|uniref:DUF6414 family protein n=1 Tax=Enterococcus TaxID=1350 RepID=UPI002891A8DB|nr:DUF6414 family protein [Enterococcus avium]MDT2386960.1 DUF6414 family protein [Enterococcus avium]MDT2447007.1 DUF6414 family protein [Enterococcus avium]
MKNNKEADKFLKIVYFDEVAANDYGTIKNGGKIDWSTNENKEKLAKLVAEIDAQAKTGFNFFSALKATISGNVSAGYDSKTVSLMESTISNTLLTDYLSLAVNDENIRVFKSEEVYAPEGSITIYKMYSSYLNIVPKEEIPIDLSELNKAILGDRGYYQMLLGSEDISTTVLRFNINAFKNSYTLADLSKMKITYYGVKVGTCTMDQLSLENEFKFEKKKKEIDVAEIVTGKQNNNSNGVLDVYDVVLGGAVSE